MKQTRNSRKEKGMARDFDGSTDGAEGPNINPTNYTWIQWLRGDVVPETVNHQTVLNGISDNAWGFSWGHTADNFRQAAFHQNSSSAFFKAKLTSILSALTWYNIAGTFGGSNLRVYLAGTEEASDGVTSTKSPTGDLAIVKKSNSFNGKISYTAIWSVKLTSNQLLAIANGVNPFAIDPSNALRLFPVDGNQSPEPDYINQANVVLDGSTKFSGNPPVELLENYL